MAATTDERIQSILTGVKEIQASPLRDDDRIVSVLGEVDDLMTDALDELHYIEEEEAE